MAMAGRHDDHHDDELDDVENTDVVTRRSPTAAEADMRLLRQAIHEHGRMMAEVNTKLVEQAEETLRLTEMCRKNAHNIKVLARRLGISAEPPRRPRLRPADSAPDPDEQ